MSSRLLLPSGSTRVILGSMKKMHALVEANRDLQVIIQLDAVMLVEFLGIRVFLVDFKAAEAMSVSHLINPMLGGNFRRKPLLEDLDKEFEEIVVMHTSANDDRFKSMFREMGRCSRVVSTVLTTKYLQNKLVAWVESKDYCGQIVICADMEMLKAAVKIFL